MIRRSRLAPLSRLLLLLALCGQLLLPVAQGQLMAQRGGGIAALACGAGSPGFAASLRDKLPAELVAAIDAEAERKAVAPCAACCVASGDPAPGFALGEAIAPASVILSERISAPQPARVAGLRLPPSRAPPTA